MTTELRNELGSAIFKAFIESADVPTGVRASLLGEVYTIREAVDMEPVIDAVLDAVLPALTAARVEGATQMREAAAQNLLDLAKSSAQAQRASDIDEGLPVIGTSTANEAEWYQMGNWASGAIRALPLPDTENGKKA